jgi:D-sedoheptulose 7-phosphate isomerase
MTYTSQYLHEVRQITTALDYDAIEQIAQHLATLRASHGRLFFLGVGGSAANASHAVNDFRKIAGIEAYAPTDNVAELTARTNDEGWETTFVEWLRISRLQVNDVVFVLSVGGGHHRASKNIMLAVMHAKSVGAAVFGIVGEFGGYTSMKADICLKVPTVNEDHVTPHAESFQSVILHLLVTHPLLKGVQ